MRRITLIHPDLLELHNLGEIEGVTRRDLGRHKVNALAEHLQHQALYDGPPPHFVAESMLSLAALVAIKATDVFFCCVDDGAAHLATCFLAVLSLKPLLEIGTAIQGVDRDMRQMGADARLVQSGSDGRCLLCLGGVAGLRQARADPLTDSIPRPRHTPADPHSWHHQGSGSLRTLDGLGVQLALWLLEDFVGNRLRDGTWLHLDVSEGGIPSLEHRPAMPRSSCSLYALAGRGDEGVCELRQLVAQL